MEAWSHTPVCLAPRVHCRIVTLASDVLTRYDHLPRTYTLPHKDTHNNNKQIVPTSRRHNAQIRIRTHCSSSGCSHRRKSFPKRVHYRFSQMVQCIIPMQRLIYCINWLASKLSLQAGPRQPAHWYPTCKSPKAVTLALADGTLVPVLPHA